MLRSPRGFTLVEVLAASLISAVVAGGTLMAFVTAARISRSAGSAPQTEAALLGRETLEKFHNRVGTDDLFFTWYLGGIPPGSQDIGPWHDDPFTPGNLATPSEGSILGPDGLGAKRCFRVLREDCDGNGTKGDCYAVQVTVRWNCAGPCTCPS